MLGMYIQNCWREGCFTEYNRALYRRDSTLLSVYTDMGTNVYINAVFGVAVVKKTDLGSNCSLGLFSLIKNKNKIIIPGSKCRVGLLSVSIPEDAIRRDSIDNASGIIKTDLPLGIIASLRLQDPIENYLLKTKMISLGGLSYGLENTLV